MNIWLQTLARYIFIDLHVKQVSVFHFNKSGCTAMLVSILCVVFAGVTTFNCTMCEKGFNTNYLLKKHMQKAHSIEMTEKMPRSEQIIIAQQQMDEVCIICFVIKSVHMSKLGMMQ